MKTNSGDVVSGNRQTSNDDLEVNLFPVNSDYLINGLKSLISEISKKFNFLLNYCDIFPDQLIIPIISENCENLNKLNFKFFTFSNRNIDKFLFSKRQVISRSACCKINHKETFMKKLNKILINLIKLNIEIFTIFQNLNIFNYEFRLFKQLNSYLFLFKEIIKNKQFEKFYDIKFLKILSGFYLYK